MLCNQCHKQSEKIIKGVCRRCYNKEYFFRNKDVLQEKSRIYNQGIREYARKAIGQKKREFQRKTIRKIIKNTERRGIIHGFSWIQWVSKLKKYHGVCPKCNMFVGQDKLTLDHILPICIAVSRPDFIYRIDDVQPLCKSCNSSKGSKFINMEKSTYIFQ